LSNPTVPCKRHPSVQTNLYCGKCGDPICPKCLVQTPVGARCPTCARMSRLPTFNISGKYYLRAGGAALGLGIATGLVWAFFRVVPYFGFFSFLIGAAVGYGIGEGISLAANRKRGPILAAVAGFAVVISYVTSILVPWGRPFYFFDIITLIIGIAVAATRVM
jgi:hypothetical protein